MTSAPDLGDIADLARQSHRVITAFQHPGGAYPASPTFSAYRGYAWLRDGAFTAEGISRYGDVSSASRFHDWVSTILTDRTASVAGLRRDAVAGRDIPVERMLPTRFTLDGEAGSDPWWDFQTDGYGMWLWAVTEHAHRHGLELGRWRTGIEVAVDYLTTFWDRPCFDWWEEHVEQRHVSTLGAIYAGLTAIASGDVLDEARRLAATGTAHAVRGQVRLAGLTRGRAADTTALHLAKWFGSAEVDASLAACIVPFGLIDPGSALAESTLDAIAADLEVDGGVHRFRADVFYGGGQWPLLACLLGWNRAVAGDRPGALRNLLWAAAQADLHGDLPEQVPDRLLAPAHRAEWIDRWGEVALPLLWSHGMFLILADELGLLPEGSDR